MLPPLLPNSRELVERTAPWLFDEDSAADLALLHAIGVLGSMRDLELALFFRGRLVQCPAEQGHGEEFAVEYPALDGRSVVTSDSAVHATRRRLSKLVDAGLLAVATTPRTTPDHLAGRYYWLSSKGTRRVLDAGYWVRSRQSIDNMSHIGSTQDKHRLLEQQYVIARRLINPSMRVWGEYAIRSGLARLPFPKASVAKPPTVKQALVDMAGELYLSPGDLGQRGGANTVANRRYFTRRPDVLLLDEQAERDRYRDAIGLNFEAQPPHAFGDVEWAEVESSKKDAVTQAKSFNGIFYLGGVFDLTLERGRVTKFTLVTRDHPRLDQRAKLLDAYERWLAKADVQAMLKKKAILTRGFDPQRLGEQVWVAELTQDSEHRLSSIRMETMASITERNWRGQV